MPWISKDEDEQQVLAKALARIEQLERQVLLLQGDVRRLESVAGVERDDDIPF